MVESETGGMIRTRSAGWVRENGIWRQRLYVGEKLPSSERTYFPYQERAGDENCVTGSVGFLDFLVQQVYDHQLTPQTPLAVELLRVGIEPTYHSRGYGLAMIEVLADKARNQGISLLVADGNVEERFPHLRKMEQLGFVRDDRFSRMGITLGDSVPPRFAYCATIQPVGPSLTIPDHP